MELNLGQGPKWRRQTREVKMGNVAKSPPKTKCTAMKDPLFCTLLELKKVKSRGVVKKAQDKINELAVADDQPYQKPWNFLIGTVECLKTLVQFKNYVI